MNGGPITLETSVSHMLFDRRSVLTIVLNGGDLTEREATVRAILAQLAPQYLGSGADPPAALSSVFALLSRPEPPHAAPGSAPGSSPAGSPYDEPFILAPLGSADPPGRDQSVVTVGGSAGGVNHPAKHNFEAG